MNNKSKYDFEMYYGVSSGQQRSALSRLEPEGVMISHASQNNKPLDGEYDLFIDCGGYNHMMTGGGTYTDSNEEYVDYLLEYEPDLYALRDYPCEPDLLKKLGRSVHNQQERTLERHIELLNILDDYSLTDSAVAVVQGWTTEQYLTHIDMLRNHGCLTDYMGIGSVCRRGEEKDIASVVLDVATALPSRTKLHAFGVKGSVLQYKEVMEVLHSADSAAYDYTVSRVPSKRTDGESFTWRDCARSYMNWRHDLLQKMGTKSLHNMNHTQSTLSVADGTMND